jgi:hypothetical protein
VRLLHLKYRTGPAASTPEVFYILFYDDPFFTSLCESWRVFVHSMKRVDVHCELGQNVGASLIIKNPVAAVQSRTVRCWASSPSEIQFSPQKEFELVGNALNEVKLVVRSRKEGYRELVVNIVGMQAIRTKGAQLCD